MTTPADDLAFKRLHAKNSSDIAEAIARNDAKRLDDVLVRIGGIDSSAFETVLKVQGPQLNMIVAQRVSGRLLVQTLARSPSEVYDWLAARRFSTPKAASISWTEFAGLRRARVWDDPRCMSKLIAACARAGRVHGLIAQVLGAEAGEERLPHHALQAAARQNERQASRLLALNFLASLSSDECSALVKKLPKGGSPEDYPRFGEAAALAEARALSSQLPSSAVRARHQSL